jgi:uroporphyrin-3 C-methyltransferase
MQHQHLIVPHARIAETARRWVSPIDAHRLGRRASACRVTITSMNELPNNPDPTNAAVPVPAPAVPAVEPRVPERRAAYWAKPQNIAILVLAVLLAVQTWSSHSRFNKLREDVARTCRRTMPRTPRPPSWCATPQETAKELQVKVGVLESRQSESQSQQAALEQMYQDVSKNRDEWALSEIEQVLSTASQQLQLAGNVQGALIALQNADRSLSRSDKPQFITIRRAIARDIDKLKALPSVDQAGIALRLDNVIGQIDKLPLLSDEKPAEPSAPGRAMLAGARQAGRRRRARAPRAWASAHRDLAQLEPRDVGRHAPADPRAHRRHAGSADAVAERIVFRAREPEAAPAERAPGPAVAQRRHLPRRPERHGQQMLVKYFDTKARSTVAVQALLRQVQANNLAIECRTLADSLNAVRNYKSKP